MNAADAAARERLNPTAPSAEDVAGGTAPSAMGTKAFAARFAAVPENMYVPNAGAGTRTAAPAVETAPSNVTVAPAPAPSTAQAAVAQGISLAVNVDRPAFSLGHVRTAEEREE